MKKAQLLRTPGRVTSGRAGQTPRRYGAGELTGEVLFADPMRLFPGQFTVYNPSVLVSRQGLTIFDKMRRDDQVKASLAFKKYAALATSWEVVSPKGQPEEWEVAEFVRQNFNDITSDERTFEDIMLEMLTSLDFGYSVSEKIYVEEGGTLWLRDLKTRKPHQIEFNQDEYGNLLEIRQNGTTGKGGTLSVPREKVVLHVNQREFDNLYGCSDLESAYRAWVVKDNSYKWLAMFLEKLGIPPVFALYNPQAYTGGVLTDLRQVIERMQAATFGVMPRRNKDDLDFWSPQLGSQANSVFIPALEMFNRDIARSILMPSLVGFTADEAQGSLARSQTHFDSFMLIIERLRKSLTAAIQAQVVQQLVDLNFGEPEEYPQFRFVPIDNETRANLLAVWQGLVASNIATAQKSDEAHIRKVLKMPERQEGDEMPKPEPVLPPTGFGIPKAKEEEEEPLSDPAEEDEEDTEEKLQALLESAGGDWEKVREPLRRLYTQALARNAA